MRDEILELLRKEANAFVSGEKMSQVCEVSRTAIWKHIKALRNKGYEIESYTKRGYRLMSEPDLVSPLEMESLLTTEYMGREYRYVNSTASTNDEARKAAQQDAPEGTVVIAEEQSAGRGRMRRGWYSPYAKGLWMSVLLRPNFAPAEAAKCTLMAAVALTKAFHEMGLTAAGIKWPNDILVNGKKLVGILTEMQGTMEEIHYIVMGMGINVSIQATDLPDDIADIATSFAMEGVPVARKELLACILKHLEAQYETVCRSGFESTLADWRKLSVTLGQAVTVHQHNGSYQGKAIDIDQDGHLLIETMSGKVERVMAGDVSIRPAHT